MPRGSAESPPSRGKVYEVPDHYCYFFTLFLIDLPDFSVTMFIRLKLIKVTCRKFHFREKFNFNYKLSSGERNKLFPRYNLQFGEVMSSERLDRASNHIFRKLMECYDRVFDKVEVSQTHYS